MMDFSKIKEILFSLPGRIMEFIHNILDRFHELDPKRKKTVIFTLGGFAILMVFVIILNIASSGSDASASSNASFSFTISHEELFFPSEPDFIPEFLLEREPRVSWSLEDIRPYWRTPGDDDFWLEEINSIINSIMEGIP